MKMLQARITSYPDAQRDRLGGNYQQLPVNQPKCPVMIHQRNGFIAKSKQLWKKHHY